MKFTITREKLQEGLLAVVSSIPTKTTLPVLSNILIEATKEGIRLSGTDLDIAVSTSVPANWSTGCSTCCVARASRYGAARQTRSYGYRQSLRTSVGVPLVC